MRVNLTMEHISDDDLAKLVIGPSGNLRAPTFFIGSTAVVGFDEETYQKLLR